MPALRSELEFIIQALFAYIRTIGGNLQNRTTQADNSMSSIKSMDSLMMKSMDLLVSKETGMRESTCMMEIKTRIGQEE